MPYSSNDIKKLPQPVIIDNVPYAYAVNGTFAETKEAAMKVVETMNTTSASIQRSVAQAVKDGVTVCWANGSRSGLAQNYNYRFYWYYDESLRMRYSIAPNGGRLPLKTYHGVTVYFDCREVPVANLRQLIAHEFGHHEWVDSSYRMATQLQLKFNNNLSKESNLLGRYLDPWAISQKRHMGEAIPQNTVNAFFEDLRDYRLKFTNNNMRFKTYHTFEPDVIFKAPVNYFKNSLKSSLASKMDVVTVERLFDKHFYQFLLKPEYNPLPKFMKDIQLAAPNVSSTELRTFISRAGRSMRAEIGSFFNQIEEVYPGLTFELAPRTSVLLERIRASTFNGIPRQRVIHLGWSGSNTPTIVPFVASKPLKGIITPLYGEFSHVAAAGCQVGIHHPQLTTMPNRVVPNKLGLNNVLRGLNRIALPLSFGMEIVNAYQADPKDKAGAVIEGAANATLKLATFTAVTAACAPAGILLAIGSAIHPETPEVHEAALRAQLNINNEVIKTIILWPEMAQYKMFYFICENSQKLMQKLDDLAMQYRYSEEGRKLATAIRPAVEAVCDTSVKVANTIVEGHSRTRYGNAVQAIFDHVDPEPSHKPEAPDQIPSFSSNYHNDPSQTYTLSPFQQNELANLELNTNLLVSIGGILVRRTTLAVDPLQMQVAPANNNAVSTQHAKVKAINYGGSCIETRLPHNKPAFLSDMRITAAGGMIGFSATMTLKGGASALLQLLFSKSGFLFSTTVNFGPGFFAALGTSLGVGAIAALPLYVGQRLYQHRQEKIFKEVKRSFQSSVRDAKDLSKRFNRFVDHVNQEGDRDYPALLKEANELIVDVDKNIIESGKRYRRAVHLKHRKVGNKHYDIIKQQYRPTYLALLETRDKLKVEQIKTSVIETYSSQSAEQLLNALILATTKSAFNNDDIVTIEALRELFINKVTTLTATGKAKEAEELSTAAEKLTYFTPGSINEFKFEESKKNDTNTKCRKIKGELNLLASRINAKIGAGQDPNDSIEKLIKKVDEKYKYYRGRFLTRGGSEYTSRMNSLIAFKKGLEAMKQNYSAGVPKCDLRFESLTNVFHQFSELKDKPATFWFFELNQIKQNGMPTFMNLPTDEAKDCAKCLIEEMAESAVLHEIENLVTEKNFIEAEKLREELIRQVPSAKDSTQLLGEVLQFGVANGTDTDKWLQKLAENMSEVASDLYTDMAENIIVGKVIDHLDKGEFDLSTDLLTKFKEVAPKRLDPLNDYISLIEDAKAHLDADEHYWLAKLKSTLGMTPSVETNIMRAIEVQRLNNLVSIYSELSFHYHAVEIMEKLAEMIPAVNTENYRKTIAESRLADQSQVGMAFARPLKAIAERQVDNMQAGRTKELLKAGLNVLHLTEIVVPTTLVIPGQALIAWRMGNMSAFKNFIQKMQCDVSKNLRNIRSIDGGLLYGQIALHILEWPVERALPITQQSSARSLKSTIITIGKPVLQAAFVAQAGLELLKYKGKSANAPQSVLTIFQNAYSSIKYVYEGYKACKGDAIEEVDYYKRHAIAKTIGDGVSNVVGMARLRQTQSVLTAGVTLFSGLNTLHAAQSVSIDEEAAVRALEACINNIDHYQLLADNQSTSRFFSSIIDNYLEDISYQLLNRDLDANDIFAVEGGYYIFVIKVDDKFTIKFRDRKAQVVEIDIEMELENDQLNKEQLDLIRQSIIAYYKEESLKNLKNILDKTFGGLHYDPLQQSTVNHARLIYLTHAASNALFAKEYVKVLTLTNIINRFHAQLIINLMDLRLRALASINNELCNNFHREYNQYITKLFTTSTSEWRATYWDKYLEQCKQLIICVMENALLLANKEQDPELKRQFLDVVMQHYTYCGNWYELLDDEYKFLAANCFFKAGQIDTCRVFLENISDIHALLRKKNSETGARAALTMFAEINPSLHQTLLNRKDKAECGVTLEVMHDEIERLLSENQVKRVLDLLRSGEPFEMQDYYLAKTHFLMGDSNNLCIAFKTLLKEPQQDKKYWQLFHQLILSLNDVIVPSLSHDLYPVFAKIQAMLCVACEKLLLCDLSDDARINITYQAKLAREQLNEYLMIERNRSHRLFHQSTDQQAEEVLSMSMQLMMGDTRKRLVRLLDDIFFVLGLLPEGIEVESIDQNGKKEADEVDQLSETIMDNRTPYTFKSTTSSI